MSVHDSDWGNMGDNELQSSYEWQAEETVH